MNEFKHARDEYESTPIPEELDSRVRAGIRQGEMGSRTKRHGFRWGIGVAAACMVMVGGLNVSPPSRRRHRMFRCWAGCSRS